MYYVPRHSEVCCTYLGIVPGCGGMFTCDIFKCTAEGSFFRYNVFEGDYWRFSKLHVIDQCDSLESKKRIYWNTILDLILGNELEQLK